MCFAASRAVSAHPLVYTRGVSRQCEDMFLLYRKCLVLWTQPLWLNRIIKDMSKNTLRAPIKQNNQFLTATFCTEKHLKLSYSLIQEDSVKHFWCVLVVFSMCPQSIGHEKWINPPEDDFVKSYSDLSWVNTATNSSTKAARLWICFLRLGVRLYKSH